MRSVNDIRSTFIDYFVKNGHESVASGPLVPRNDPTLMFTNAGMVQFKNLFTGLETRDYTQAVTSQKCVRAGGKHNDLDNVGFTARHHTFFEMLGNFSFGDYFKDQAIELAWNLLTKEFELPKDKLLVTIYHDDEEAFEFWKKIAGLSEDKIIRIATSDNFWSMGETGPCGPCSEIFFDHGDKIWGGPPGSPEEDGDRFIEIWNLVFMQFEQSESGRENLPKPSIDTGMGLERISALLQGTHDNYETDLFKTLIEASAHATNTDPFGDKNTSHRVITDHLRASSFLIADGVLPSNEGRGYVLRRIMRRAMRHANMLGVKDPVIYKLVPTLVREMGEAYPELRHAEPMITETLQSEEERFLKTLSRGLNILNDESVDLSKGDTLSGDVAFKLYDTYGFPLDLTQDALRLREIDVDEDGFASAMEKQKEVARASWSGSGGEKADELWFELAKDIEPTEFLGYETEQAEGLVLALTVAGAKVTELGKGQEGSVILNQTPFYGESGGQVGDTGVLSGADFEFTVSDTKKVAGGLFAHFGTLKSGTLKSGDAVQALVESKRRSSIRANHSATHLLHEALRSVLGPHVAQKGSLVSPTRLRFDFSHNKGVEAEQIAEIERLANDIITQNSPVETRLMGVEEAKESGAMALFGEKYGDEVRVVSMGQALEGEKAGKAYSVELCGGTHVTRTGDIGLVKVVAEGAVASGVRRLEALTGVEARRYLDGQDVRVKNLANQLKVAPHDLEERLAGLITERRQLEKSLGDAKKQLAMGGTGDGDSSDDVEKIGDVTFMGKVAQGLPSKELRGLVDAGKKQIGSGIVVIVGVDEGKAGIAVGVSDDLSETFSAVDLVRVGAAALGGKGGGGRADMAQAGGPDGDKADGAIAAIKAAIANG